MRFLFSLFFFFFSFLYANWNSDFDQKTIQLSETIDNFKGQEFLGNITNLMNLRDLILKNEGLSQAVRGNGKATIFHPSLDAYTKRRNNNNLNDAFAWELSCLFTLSKFIIPSLPFDIDNQKIILQKRRDLVVGSKYEPHPSKYIKRLGLIDYWKMNLLAYILGLGDLTNRNVGITEQGEVLLFDNEIAFQLRKAPYPAEESFFTILYKYIFHNVTFDWPQYERPLDQEAYTSLQLLFLRLEKAKNEIAAYQSLRSGPNFYDKIIERIEEVLRFPLKEGQKFRDFYLYLYPHLGSGLDDLSRIVSKQLKKSVGHGTALYYTTWEVKRKGERNLRPSLQKWIHRFIIKES